MFKNVKWLRNKFVVVWLCMCFVLVSGVPSRAIAQETGWMIRQSVSASFAQPKDVIQLSVYVQGMTSSMEVSEIRGVLEYDSSLFTVQNIVGNGLGTAGVDNSGDFVLSNSAGKFLGNGDLLFHILLMVSDNASVGKTTICVNEITISDTSGTSNQISNYVPSTINLEDAASTEEPEDEEFEDESYEEDENWAEEEPEDEQNEEEEDWEEEDWEDEDWEDDFDDIDDYHALEINKDVPKPSSESKDPTVTVSKNPTVTVSKNPTVSVSKNQTTISSVAVQKPTKGDKEDKLDENYKTGAGFGNDIYLILAGIMGVGSIGVILLRRKLMKEKFRYL